MKTYKYWVQESVPIQINGDKQPIKLLSGSNVSQQDAHGRLAELAKRIEERIRLRQPRQQYEAEIREHVVQAIDENNVITICRYGAWILNSTQYAFYDLDDVPRSFWDMFRSWDRNQRKDRIVQKFKENYVRYPELGDSFRIYETFAGIRVIGRQYLAPQHPRFDTIMRGLVVDDLYHLLCKKQQCYRARLTPKPYRMRFSAIKIRSPLDCQTDQYRQWAVRYETASRRFRVVKLLETICADFGHEMVVQLHDQLTLSTTEGRLA